MISFQPQIAVISPKPMLEAPLLGSNNWDLQQFPSIEALVQQNSDLPDLIVLKGPNSSVQADLNRLKANTVLQSIPVIVISPQNDIQSALNLLQKGAADYIVSNNQLGKKLTDSIREVFAYQALQAEINQLRSSNRKGLWRTALTAAALAAMLLFVLVF